MATPSPLPSSNVLQCIVTDDDALSRRTIEGHIAHSPGLALAGTFDDGVQLLDFLRDSPLPVDVLFLDVQMPLLSGLDVIRLLPNAPAVVLTTGRADFAVEAFALRVVDYLVKPIEYPRFLQAVERIRRQATSSAGAIAPPVAAAPTDRSGAIFIKNGGRTTRILHADILYLEAVNDQVVIVLTKGQLSTSQLLHEVTGRLPEAQFVRVHRSFVVNRNRIISIEDATLTLEGGRQLPIGRTYLADFLASFPTTGR